MPSTYRSLGWPVAVSVSVALFGLLPCASGQASGRFLGGRIATLRPAAIDVKSFGAVGDGVTDDRAAIQAALTAAHNLGSASVFFEPGVYNLASATSPNGLLAISDWSKPFSIDLIGDQATLQTSMATSILFAEGLWQNSRVHGLTFLNLHPVTMATSAAIVFSGGSPNGIVNWSIYGNTFRNFSRHITTSGVTGLTISNNTFGMDNGRDSGTSLNPEPNVGVWMFNNSPNGNSANIQIVANVFDGCGSGNVSNTVSRRCGDGFVYGQGDNVLVQSNLIRRFSYEGIYMFRGAPTDTPPVIQSNTVDGTIVTGDISGGGQWGIRCDADGANVLQNTVTNSLNGIIIYGANLPTDVENSTIANNTIVTTVGNTQQITSGIQITAASNIHITGNTLDMASAPGGAQEVSLIYLTGLLTRQSSGLTVSNNSIIASLSGPSVTSGIFLQWTNGWTIASNSIQSVGAGFHLLNLSGPASQLTGLTSQNMLKNDGQNVMVTNGLFQ
jgi:hypothetical protein